MSLAYDVSRATARAAEGHDPIAVVLALPGDSAESVLQRILAADAPTAYVIVSEDTTCFRRVRDTNFLRRAAQQAGLRILIVTADSLTVTASRWSGLEVILCRDEPAGEHQQQVERPAGDAAPVPGRLEAGLLLAGADVTPVPPPTADNAPPAAPVRSRAAQTRRRPGLSSVVWALLILLIGALAFALFARLRVEVVIFPPREPDLTVSVNLSENAAEALAFQPIEQTFDVQLVGNFANEPISAANGGVRVQNRSTTSITFPEGSRFIARSADGGELAFTATGEIVVPGATRITGTLGDVVVAGEAGFGLTALEPGSQGNIPADALQYVRTPDGRTVLLNSEPLWLSHLAFSGGGESAAAAVTQDAIERLIAGQRSEIQAQADFRVAQIAQQRGMLLIEGGANQGTQLSFSTARVQPPLGSLLRSTEDRFTVTMRVAASARAVPFNSESERAAAARAFSAALQQNGLISDDECSTAQLDRLAWEGSRLVAHGRLAERSACLSVPPMTTRLRLSDALRGLDQSAARAVLERYVADGVISGYQIPPVERLPGWSWLIAITAP